MYMHLMTNALWNGTNAKEDVMANSNIHLLNAGTRNVYYTELCVSESHFVIMHTNCPGESMR